MSEGSTIWAAKSIVDLRWVGRNSPTKDLDMCQSPIGHYFGIVKSLDMY